MKYIESEQVELKEKINDSLSKEIVAFLNTSGGRIYIGITDNGKIVGIDKIDNALKIIADVISDTITPNAKSLIKNHIIIEDNKNVIEIEISKGVKPIYHIKKYGLSPKGCFLRLGSTCREMDEEEISQRYKLSLRGDDYLVDFESYFDNLSFQTFKIILSEHGFHINDTGFEGSFKLRTKSGRYNLLAELLSDNNNIPMIVAKFKGLDKAEILEKSDYGSRCIISSIEKVLTRVDVENAMFSDTSIRPRVDKRLIDPFCLKEAIINAIVHNDWTISQPAVYIFDDRIEIISYGGLPLEESLEDFYGGISHPRSDTLMRIFLSLDLVEHTGHGIPNIVKKYGRECFKITNNYILVSLPFDRTILEKVRNVRLNVGLNVRLSDTQKGMIDLLKDNPKLNAQEIAVLLSKSKKTIERNFIELQKNNIIERAGSKRDGYWIVIE